MQPRPIHLADRQIIEVRGPDACDLLQGILTQDVANMAIGEVRHAALLTPQGKYLFDALMFRQGADCYWLDALNAPAFAARLKMYRLRSKVSIEVRADLASIAVPPGAHCTAPAEARAIDPRLSALGERVVATTDALEETCDDSPAWDQLRIGLGVPELARDLEAEKDFALEGLLDELCGVDFHKGCYVGQEMTSRMKRRTTVRTKLVRVTIQGELPPHNTPVLAGEWDVGRTRSALPGIGLALIRLDRAQAALADGTPLMAGPAHIVLDPPAWLTLPDRENP